MRFFRDLSVRAKLFGGSALFCCWRWWWVLS